MKRALSAQPNDSVWVIIPAYNEAPVIASVLDSFKKTPYHVVVVDDGSKDLTSKIARLYPVDLIRHRINLGQGAAIQTGIDYVLSRTCEYIVTFDADGQHTTEDIPSLIEPIRKNQADIVLGSRFIKGARVHGITARRKLMLRLAILFTRMTTGLKVTDTHNGLRAFSRHAASMIRITQNGMAHASEIFFEIAKYKLRYCEVPVQVRYTPYTLKKGQSLFNSINILLDLLIRRDK
jgi:glycosyltransferase involved in cell wall biosynthesis